MDLKNHPLIVCGFVLACIGLVHSQDVIIGIIGESVEIPCDATGAEWVRWTDYIWNQNNDPIEIFDSRNNPTKSISSSHPKSDSFEITSDFSLKIKKTQRDLLGDYICYTYTTEEVEKRTQVAGYSRPVCKSPPAVLAGKSADLTCEFEFKANSIIPHSEWKDEAGTAQTSREDSGIGTFKRVLSVIDVQGDQNGEVFTCTGGLNDNEQSCTATLKVVYTMDEITISESVGDQYHVGEDIICSGNGNPKPLVKWMKNGNPAAEGSGSATYTVLEEDTLTSTTLQCTAIQEKSSGVDGAELSEEVVFTAKDQNNADPDSSSKAPSTTTKKPTVTESGTAASTGGVSTAGVVGGIIAAVIIIIVIVAIIYIAKKRNKPKGAKKVPSKDPEEQKNDIDTKGDIHNAETMLMRQSSEKRQYSPAPSDPRYNSDGLQYAELAFQNNNESGGAAVWERNPNNGSLYKNTSPPPIINDEEDVQYAQIRRQ